MDLLFEIGFNIVSFLTANQIAGESYQAVMGWDDLLYMIAIWVISAALTPKPKGPKPAAFEDFEFPKAEEGTPQAVFFGDVWTGGWMVLSYGNYRTKSIKSGGK